MFQIGTSSEDYLDHLKRARSLHSPAYEELLPLLSRLLSLSGPIVIVIDALDECPERGREGLFHFLEHLRSLRSKDNINIRVLATSRPEIDIQNCMSSIATYHLNVNESRKHTDDIRSYISTQLFGRESRAYSGWSEDVKWKVFDVLMRRSKGM